MVKRKTKKSSSKKSSSKIWIKLLTFFTIITIWSVVILGVVVFWFGYDLPNLHELQTLTRKPGITILDKDGRLIATRGDIFGEAITVNTVPLHVSQAILAIEDRRFYDHFGIDAFGILRAAYINFQAGRIVQGGSTLTQQLAKNFLLSQQKFDTNDRSFKRKVQEVILALWIESVFTKDQILTIYMNRAYLGSGVFGIQAAARKYFNKRAKDLDLVESATIAGLLKAPTAYSPLSHPKRSQQRTKVVLNAMLDAGYITEKELQKKQLTYDKPSDDIAISAGYFVDWVLEQIPNLIKDRNNDLIIHTTLDSRFQQKASEQTHTILSKFEGKRVSQAAVIAMHPDGAVRAMIGGKDYRQTQFNRSVQAQRQSGSAYKLFIYLEALRKGYTPDSIISDAPIKIGSWKPKNYGWSSQGDVTLRSAFAYSINTATIRLGQKLGTKSINNLAYELGIKTQQPKDLSVLLGSGNTSLTDLTSAYACIANGGFKVVPYCIMKITTNNGKVLFQQPKKSLRRILPESIVMQMAELLKAVIRYGTGKAAKTDVLAAGKTGTSQLNRDAWFIGFASHPNYVTGVWMGNDTMTPMDHVTGGTLPAQLWKAIMHF